MIRNATLGDVPELTALEERCFECDRLSVRSFRYLISRGNATLLVDEEGGVIRGYFLALYHKGTSLARLYSTAVLHEYRGAGVGAGLLAAIEAAATGRGAVSMRLEARADNAAGRRFWAHHGFRDFAVRHDYYQDHEDAIRMEKLLVPHLAPGLSRVPYYRQTLFFTCGPACLLMAMAALDPAIEVSRTHELRLWREATTIFMTTGLGGCGPLGLALAAWHRGFGVSLSMSDPAEMFVDTVRSVDRREVIRLVQEDMAAQLAETGVEVRETPWDVEELRAALAAGRIPIVLINSYYFHGDSEPHWVVVAGADERFFYVHDPYVDADEGKTETDCVGIPVLAEDFDRMVRRGHQKHRACMLIDRRDGAAAA